MLILHVAGYDGFSVSPITVKQGSFPDGTLHLDLPNYEVHTVEWRYESDAELFTLICIAKHYAKYGLELFMPYIPHARMDRVKSHSDVFTLKYFCEIINSLNFKEVRVFDAHSNVSLALLDRVVQMSPKTAIETAIYDFTCKIAGDCGHNARAAAQDNLVLFFPDEGAMKRYSSDFDAPYAFGIKKRDWATGNILGLDIMNKEIVKGENVLIIDDICSRGGTFLYSAEALKEAGAERIALYVSHAEKTMIDGDMYRSDNIEHIYTTNSIFKKEWDVRNKVSIIDY